VGIEALKTAVEAEGRERAARIRRAAEQEAARIRDEAENERDRRIARALRDREPGLRRELGGRLDAARREARARVLAQRDAFLDRVFDAARRALPRDLTTPGTRAAFEARLARALEQLPEPVVVGCPPPLADVAGATVAGRAGVRVQPDPDLESGFRARCDEAGLEVDGTLATLLELHRPRLAIEVLHRLGAAEEDPSP
jgi:vacuolar-type H+-ATPase subunit E/Vma4